MYVACKCLLKVSETGEEDTEPTPPRCVQAGPHVGMTSLQNESNEEVYL